MLSDVEVSVQEMIDSELGFTCEYCLESLKRKFFFFEKKLPDITCSAAAKWVVTFTTDGCRADHEHLWMLCNDHILKIKDFPKDCEIVCGGGKAVRMGKLHILSISSL